VKTICDMHITSSINKRSVGLTHNIRVRQWNIIQLLPALKVNNYEVHRKCRQ
jgi:hypothetical protein